MDATRNSLFPFLLASTAFHLLLVLTWYGRPVRQPFTEMIPVTVLPSAPAVEKPPPRESSKAPPPKPLPPQQAQPPQETTARAELPPGQPAKESRSGAEMPAKSQQISVEKTETAERPVDTRPRKAERETVVASGLPTMKDLLPPGFSRSPGGKRSEQPIRLDDRDPKHVAYLSLIHQALKNAWNDPNIARYATRPSRLAGTPVVEFTIDEDGNLAEVYLKHTSGYSVLDQEAMRIVKAAAPYFGVIPRSLGKNKIVIDVKVVYENDAPTYSFDSR